MREEGFQYGAVALIVKEAALYEEGNDEPIAEEFYASDFWYASTSMFTNAKLKVGKKYNVVIPIYGLQLINQMNDECYWTNTAAINMSFEVTPELVFSNLVITEAGWATYSAPFDVDLNTRRINATAYIVNGVEDDVLVMSKIKSGIIPAYQPVVLFGDETREPISGEAVDDYDTPQGIMMSAMEDDMPAEKGMYVLQNQNGKAGFYLVEEDGKITIPAWKCFLMEGYFEAPDYGTDPLVKAFYFENATTAINKLTSADKKQIFDVNGRQINKLQKGINIVNGVKILVK